MLRNRLGSISQDSEIAVAVSAPTGLFVYKWGADGFGARYSNPPGVWNASFLGGNSFSPDGNSFVATSPYYSATKTVAVAWSGKSGAGAALTSPQSPEDYDPRGKVAFNGTGLAVAFSEPVFDGTDYRYLVFRYSSTGFGSRYSLLTDTFGGAIQAAAPCFSSAGTAIVCFGKFPSVSYAIGAYRWSDLTGFGTAYASPAAHPSSDVRNIFFHPDNSAVGWTQASGQGPTVYRWTEVSGFGTQFSNPVGRQTLCVFSKFTPDGLANITTGSNAPYITAFAWSSSGFGTKYADASYSPPQNSPSDTFKAFGAFDISPEGDTIVVGQTGPVNVAAIRWSSVSGFGVKLSDPQTYTSSMPVQISFRKIPN